MKIKTAVKAGAFNLVGANSGGVNTGSATVANIGQVIPVGGNNIAVQG